MRTIHSPFEFEENASRKGTFLTKSLHQKPSPTANSTAKDREMLTKTSAKAGDYLCDFVDKSQTSSLISFGSKRLTVLQKKLLKDYHDLRLCHNPNPNLYPNPNRNRNLPEKEQQQKPHPSAYKKPWKLLQRAEERPGIKSIEEIILLRRKRGNQEKERSKRELLMTQVTLNIRDKDPRPATAHEVKVLAEECRSVVKRIEALEKAKLGIRPGTVAGKRILKGELHKGLGREIQVNVGFRVGRGLGGNESEEVIRSMDGIQQTLSQLDKTLTPLKKVDQVELERQFNAATRLSAVYRRSLARRKYLAAIQALRSWRVESGAQEICNRYAFLHQKREVFERKCKELHEQRLMNIKLSCFNALVEYRVKMRPVKERLQAAIHGFLAKANTQLVEAVFRAWHEEASGPNSSKAVKDRNKQRYREMRNKLEEEQLQLDERRQKKITHELVVEALGKEAVAKMMAQQSTKTLKIYFKAWVRDAMEAFNFMKKKAATFRRKHALPRFFTGWKEYVQLAQEEAQVHRSWIRSGFDVQHNSSKIQAYWRIKTQHRYFSLLRTITSQLRAVRRKIASVDTARKRQCFEAFLQQVRFQKQVKLLCVQEWQRFSRVWREVPFKAWYLWLQQKKRRREKREILVAAFRRRQNRRRQTRCFRTWSHQTLYGRVDGMLSRADLIDAFNRQKRSCNAMEIAMENAKNALKQTRDAVGKERRRVGDLSQQLSAKLEETLELKCIQERLEAEIVRLQTMLDSMANMHPGTARKLRMDTETKEQRQFSNATRQAAMKNTFGDPTTSTSPEDQEAPANALDSLSKALDLNKVEDFDNSVEKRGAYSARLVASQRKPLPFALSTQVEAEGLSWVTREDSQMLLRCEWAKQKLLELLHESSDSDVNEDEVTLAKDGPSSPEKVQELRTRRLSQVLSFLFTGDTTSPLFAMPDARKDKELSEKARALEIERLDSSIVWNDFVQSVAAEFPLKHPMNVEVKQKIEARLFQTHAHAYERQVHKAPPLNIYKPV